MSNTAASEKLPPEKPARPRNLGTHAFLACCIVMVSTFLIWATIGKLDVVSVATGEVVPASQVKSVQHLEGGIIRKILVKEGAKVKQGQPLIELEPTRSRAELDELFIRMAALRGNIARLHAEAVGARGIEIPEDLKSSEPELVEQTTRLFNTRARRMNNQLQGQDQLLIQREQEIKEVEARLRSSANSI